jgi:hypothetical protein
VLRKTERALVSAEDMNVKQIEGLIMLVLGVMLVMFRDRFAKSTARDQMRWWGIRYGERDIVSVRMLVMLGGAAMAVVGVLRFFDLIRFRH